jgi:hypothetical protein
MNRKIHQAGKYDTKEQEVRSIFGDEHDHSNRKLGLQQWCQLVLPVHCEAYDQQVIATYELHLCGECQGGNLRAPSRSNQQRPVGHTMKRLLLMHQRHMPWPFRKNEARGAAARKRPYRSHPLHVTIPKQV